MVSMPWKMVSKTQYRFYKIIPWNMLICTFISKKKYTSIVLTYWNNINYTTLYGATLQWILKSALFFISIFLSHNRQKQITSKHQTFFSTLWQLLSSILTQMKTNKDHKWLIIQDSIIVAPQELKGYTNWTLVGPK